MDKRNTPVDPWEKILSPTVDHIDEALRDYHIESRDFLHRIAVCVYMANDKNDHSGNDFINERLKAVGVLEGALREYNRLLYLESDDPVDSDRQHVMERLHFHLNLDKNALVRMISVRAKGFSSVNEHINSLLEALTGTPSIQIDGKPLTREQAQDALRKIHIHKKRNLLLNIGWTAIKKRLSEWRHRFDIPLAGHSEKVPDRRNKRKRKPPAQSVTSSPSPQKTSTKSVPSPAKKTRSPRKPTLAEPPKTIRSKRR